MLDHMDTKAPKSSSGDIFLKLHNPTDNAAEFVKHTCHRRGKALRRYRNTWYRWEGPSYHKLDIEAAQVEVRRFLESGVYLTFGAKDDAGNTQREKHAFKPTSRDVSELLSALVARCEVRVDDQINAPDWLPGALPDQKAHRPEDILSCANGLLDVTTGELLPHSANFLTMNSVPFDFDREATCPQFDTFLDQVQPGSVSVRPSDEEFAELPAELQDRQNRRDGTLEAMFYLISGDNSQEKAIQFVGRKRSGKGTLGFLARKLVSEKNIVGF
jgi:putative DNA primase/helicase